ncbi:MAG: hypothetical protein KGI54_14035 [Pseudomonadota bacterium]|nr:hypothetical protein [Pseudomonadota bacterium]
MKEIKAVIDFANFPGNLKGTGQTGWMEEEAKRQGIDIHKPYRLLTPSPTVFHLIQEKPE